MGTLGLIRGFAPHVKISVSETLQRKQNEAAQKISKFQSDKKLEQDVYQAQREERANRWFNGQTLSSVK